jgi:hypothetical protein
LRLLPPSRPARSCLVAEVVGHPALKGGLQHSLRQLLQQAAFAPQLEVTGTSAVHQHPDQLVVHRLNGRSVHGLSRHVSHW